MVFQELAHRALGQGYSCFPVLCYVGTNGKREKRPLVDNWTRYALTKPTEEEINRWALSPLINRFAGVGVPTGNGLAVIDLDASHPISFNELDCFDWYALETFTSWVRTGGGGIHLYTRGDLKNGTNLFKANKDAGEIAVDTRGTGGFVVGSGSPLWSCDPSKGVATLVSTYEGNVEPLGLLPPTPSVFYTPSENAPRALGYAKLADKDVIPKGQGERHQVAISLAMMVANRATDGKDLDLKRETFRDLIRQKLEGTDPDDEEYQTIWATASAKIRKERGVMWSTLIPAMRQSLSEQSTRQELQKWNFKVLKAKRINELVRFTLEHEDGKLGTMQMEVKDMYQQNRFREAFTIGTNRILERIKTNAFETFIGSIAIDEMKDTGTSVYELIVDNLTLASTRVAESETLEEAEEAMRTRGYGKFQGILKFRITRFKNEYDLRGIKPAAIVQAIQDAGAYMSAKGVWEWNINAK